MSRDTDISSSASSPAAWRLGTVSMWISLTEVHLQLRLPTFRGKILTPSCMKVNCKFHVEMEFQLEMTLQLLYPTQCLGQIQQDPHFLMDSWAFIQSSIWQDWSSKGLKALSHGATSKNTQFSLILCIWHHINWNHIETWLVFKKLGEMYKEMPLLIGLPALWSRCYHMSMNPLPASCSSGKKASLILPTVGHQGRKDLSQTMAKGEQGLSYGLFPA